MPDQSSLITVNNALDDLVGTGANGLATPYVTPQQIAQPFTFIEGSAYSPFSLNRIALSYGYMTYGLVQTLIDAPVDDAFKGGIQIDSNELAPEDLMELYEAMTEWNDIEAIKATAKWARLYGGAGLIIATDDNPMAKIDIERIKKGSLLKFIAADRWQLTLNAALINTQFPYADDEGPEYYQYGPIRLNKTHVIPFLGREAPSFIRQRLQGWGMSELERCMREINCYIKFQNLLYELVDEAKIDVYKIEQFNTQLATAEGTALIQLRMQLANAIKNYKNAIVMDTEDDYNQKQISFGGLADIMEEFRINLAASLKIPLNKLFGQSATGFSSGEDSQENYNSMIESDVREKCRPLIREVLRARMMQVFGFIPKFNFRFEPLRMLNGVEEEAVKTSEQNRALALFDRDIVTGKELTNILRKSELISIETEVGDGEREPMPRMGAGVGADAATGSVGMGKDGKDPSNRNPPKEKQNGMERLRRLIDRRTAK